MLSWGVPNCQPELFPGTQSLLVSAFPPEMEPVGLTPRMMQGTCAAPTPAQPAIFQHGGQQPWVPGVSQMQGMITTTPMVAPGYAQVCWSSPTQGLNQFTFTSPTATQSNSGLLPFQSLQSQVAPGMGVFWQHAVPKQMPWVQDSSSSRPELVNFSGGHMSIPQNGQFLNEKAGCHRRLKRAADDGLMEPPSKQHVTEERMAAELQGLYISDRAMAGAMMAQEPQTTQPLGAVSGQQTVGVQQAPPVDWPIPGQEPLSQEQMWERYKEVERRLAMSQEAEEEAAEEEIKTGVLKILCEDINKNIEPPKVFPTPSLPVLENNINREKSMQLVLWKPSPLSGILASGSASSSEEEEEEEFSSCEPRDALNSMTETNNNNVDCMDSMDIDLMDSDDLDL